MDRIETDMEEMMRMAESIAQKEANNGYHPRYFPPVLKEEENIMTIESEKCVDESFFESINMRALAADDTVSEIAVTTDNIVEWLNECDNENALVFISTFSKHKAMQINEMDQVF